MRSVLS